ncbi:MAG: pyridoxal phosphate-dependent aminotransferase [bacterium]
MNNASSSPQFSQLTKRLDAGNSDAWAVHDEALELKRRGEDVIMLSIGDPDFRTPDPIIDNAASHMRVGRTHYSPALGELNLRRAVADYESRVSPHRCQVEEVAIFPGVTSAIYSVMSCLLDPGDGVVIVDPMYVGYEPILRALQANAQVVYARSEQGFVPSFEDITAAVDATTRVVFINTPANPTGAIMEQELLSKLAAWCQQQNIWLVCDEIYSMLTYHQPHVSLRTAARSLDKVVVIDGLSKSHAMSGWRMGWAVGPQDLVDHLGNFSAMSVFGCPQFIQDAAAFALNNDEYYVQDMRDRYQLRRDKVCERLDQIPSISYHKPESGMFIMIDVTKVEANDSVFAKKLLDAECVSVLPGMAFGESTRGHVRFSLVQPMNALMEGCTRLQNYIEGK